MVRHSIGRNRANQIAVATGLALALFAGGRSVAAFVSREFGFYHYSIEVDASSGSGLDGRAMAIAAATPGVSRVEPLVESQVQYREAAIRRGAWARIRSTRTGSAPAAGSPPLTTPPGCHRSYSDRSEVSAGPKAAVSRTFGS